MYWVCFVHLWSIKSRCVFLACVLVVEVSVCILSACCICVGCGKLLCVLSIHWSLLKAGLLCAHPQCVLFG